MNHEYRATCLTCGHVIDIRDPAIGTIRQGNYARYYHLNPEGCPAEFWIEQETHMRHKAEREELAVAE